MKKLIKIFLFFSIFSFVLFSCKKEPEIIIEKEYITVTDTIVVQDTVIVFEPIPDTVTTFILVRHAENPLGTNTFLSATGVARALDLRRVLENVPLEAVLSSNYNRTLQTADTVAVNHSLSVSIYDAFAIENTVDENLLLYKNKIILVVGHSNTTSEMLNILTGTTDYVTLPETAYDNLYIVYVHSKGVSDVTHMKYGL